MAVLAVFSPYWLLILLCMPALYLLMSYLYRSMYRRMNHIAFELLDPELLENEAQIFYTVLRGPNMMNIYHMYESLKYDLRGEYGSAHECNMSVSSKNARLAESAKWDQVYSGIRAGNLPMAENLLGQLAEATPAQNSDLTASKLHTLGLYHLEKGEYTMAEEQLLSSLKQSKMALAKLNCFFDLARLYEMEDKKEQAAERYRQAAAIGPKTWLGREAARRGALCQ